jgi:hypothetical protein
MGVPSFPACPPADNVATYASPCDNSTAAWLLHPPTSVPLGQLVPLPPPAPGHECWSPSSSTRPPWLGLGLRGHFNQSAGGHYYQRVSTPTSRGPPQAAASRVRLALPQCRETLCGRLRNLIGNCCGACIRSRSNASASVSLPRSTVSCTMARRVATRATFKSSGFSNNVIGRWRVSSTIRGALLHS